MENLLYYTYLMVDQLLKGKALEQPIVPQLVLYTQDQVLQVQSMLGDTWVFIAILDVILFFNLHYLF